MTLSVMQLRVGESRPGYTDPTAPSVSDREIRSSRHTPLIFQ